MPFKEVVGKEGTVKMPQMYTNVQHAHQLGLQAQPSHLIWIVLYVSSLNSNMVNPPSMHRDSASDLLPFQGVRLKKSISFENGSRARTHLGVLVYVRNSRQNRKMAKPSPSHVVLRRFWHADRKLKPCGSHPPASSERIGSIQIQAAHPG